MHPVRKRRLTYALLIVLGVGAATAVALTAFQDNVMFFYSPTEVSQGKAPEQRAFRMGGLVANGSVEQTEGGLGVQFTVTDHANTVDVAYTGILPDLFREGQGVVVQGRLEDGTFRATEVLAKHDENYMPPEVHEALKAGKTLEAGD